MKRQCFFLSLITCLLVGMLLTGCSPGSKASQQYSLYRNDVQVGLDAGSAGLTGMELYVATLPPGDQKDKQVANLGKVRAALEKVRVVMTALDLIFPAPPVPPATQPSSQPSTG